MVVRDATSADLGAIEAIYRHYVLTSTCTFQIEPGTLDERAQWFHEHGPRHPVLVVEEGGEGGEVVAWGSLSRYHRREGYAPTVESSIYVRDDWRGRGLGKTLLAALIARAEEAGHRSILAVVAGDQPASLALHEGFGFVRVGLLKAVGFKFGRWLDVAFMQRELLPVTGANSQPA